MREVDRVLETIRGGLLASLALFFCGSVASAQVPGIPEGDNARPGLNGQPARSVYDHSSAPRASAVRAVEGLDLDGRLDEAIWTSAPPITDFIQEDPFEGEPSSERSEIRVVYDDDAIYIGAMLYDRFPVTTRLTRRDGGLGDSDFIQVSLDSYHDHETAYRFTVNPSGAIRDAVASSGGGGGGGGGGFGGGGGDTSWDPVWEVATEISDAGWSAEMRIPFSQLRFSPDDQQVWGIEIQRNIHRNQERVSFPFTPVLERGGTSRFAHLDGIQGIEPGRRLELLPYVAARGEYIQQPPLPQDVNFQNPYRSGSDYFRDAGLDFKYRLTSNVTLDATVNPDFGQVELDPSVINLTAFETRYAERRPFFIEGGDIFQFGEGGPGGSTGRPPQLFYSRRIGRSPSGSVPSEAVFSDEIAATTIVGAAKVTGRVAGGWSLGLLEAVTAEEQVAYVDADRTFGETMVEPRTNYMVARLRRQIRGGETRFGVVASATNRDLGESELSARLHSAAYSGGVDFAHEWSDRTYRISTAFTVSHVQGNEEAILRTQRSSTRYYQRPDQTHLQLDPNATSLSGYYAMVDVVKQAGAFGAKAAVAAASPGYEVNDLGFQSASDRIILDTNFSYNQPDPGRILRNWNVRGSPDAVWNYAGDRIWTEVNGNFNWEFLNYWGGGIRLAYNPPHDDDRLTRGGPMAGTPERFAVTLSMDSDSRRQTVGRANYVWTVEEGGGWRHDLNVNLTANPSERVSVRLGPRLDRRHESAQYVTAIDIDSGDDPRWTDTYGRRYVFGGLDQTTVSIDARVNVTFSPTLSLQLYAEPFISTGDYRTLKEYERAGTFDFLTYGRDVGTIDRDLSGDLLIDPDGAGAAEAFLVSDPNFSYRSLLGNAVLRWEWRQGSTLYFVWQQRRISSFEGRGYGTGDEWVGDFDLNRDVGDMFGTRPDNIFVIKMNYWLNP